MEEFQKIHQFITFSVNTPAQFAYADFMTNNDYYLDLAGFYQKKRDLFLDLMQGSRFKAMPCSGTYFQMMSYADISNEPDIDFSRRITLENNVASIPTSVFYGDRTDHKMVRFCFAKKDETLIKAAELLCKI